MFRTLHFLLLMFKSTRDQGKAKCKRLHRSLKRDEPIVIRRLPRKTCFPTYPFTGEESKETTFL